jgi:molybdenum cofactor synthesis domain-containing protein
MAEGVRTAGLIVVGNEILSGKVVDTNGPFVARELRALGVELRRILTIPDEVGEIAAAVQAFHAAYDVVFTSGGIGPTHDDVTVEGVAAGLGRRVVRHPAIETRLVEFYKAQVNEARLKMADVPEGAELIVDRQLGFPTMVVDGVYVLPGIPSLFEQKFRGLRERFAGDPYHLRIVYTKEGEGSIAEYLNATVAAYPDLMLGSYPKLGDPEYAVRLTLESKDRQYVESALAHLLALLPPDWVVRVE